MDNVTLTKSVVIDFLCVFAVGFPILILKLLAVPFSRGFFCSDVTIRYPFKNSTVPDFVLYIVGLGLPIAVMLTFEVLLSKQKTAEKAPLFIYGWRIPLWVINGYKTIGVFCFGAACSQLLTDIGKYSIGRLRPHFIDVCDPDLDCSSTANKFTYIQTFNCKNDNIKMLRDARLSFPSGHSSFSAYTMVYLAIYLQCRLNWKGSYLLKHFFQFCCLSLSWATALSRVSDNKHHWSDVTVGLLIGILVAIINARYVSTLFLTQKVEKNASESTTLTSSSHHAMIERSNLPSEI